MLLTAEMFLTRHLKPNEMHVCPFALPFSNTVRLEDQFRKVHIPDVMIEGSTADFSMVAGDFLEVYEDQQEEWNAIVTCYFIDTAKNIVRYIELIHALLRTGGVWVNTGPLLYHFEGHAKEPSIELSVEEIRLLCKRVGLEIEHEQFGESTYAQNMHSMHQTVYRTWSFRARKVAVNVQ
ncbi:hypothetical protein PSACC_00404 [Paramicrosporidium saccamoebae]|uniref:carnosine N-methyltransferase n=1 Tax=Paramicrosporidium saccamoebae TaxID=1246581 RepID=A0A2H9TPW1_9FUNG|nr:hypothetical protein PSACC_00404 [Paramicrosporidium saccamoebae]